MVNPQRGELQIKLGKNNLKARLTIDSLIKNEDSVGCSVVQMAQKLSEGKASTFEIIQILTPAIKGGGNDVDFNSIKKMVWEAGLVDGMRCAGEILTVALQSGQNEGNEQAEENNPT